MPNIEQLKQMINRVTYHNKFHNTDRDWNSWVFGEWFGSRCNDSCLALANYVASNYSDIKLYWIARENCIGLDSLNDRIKVLKMNSNDSINVLKKAGVVFVNEGLQDLTDEGYNYSAGAIIVNLWHGVPWKKIGMDSYRRNQIYTRMYARTIFKLQDFSFFPSPSDLCTKALCSGFMLSQKNIIETGLPRNSLFYKKEKCTAVRNKILKEIPSRSIDIDENTKILSYLPTFRDSVQNSFSFDEIGNSEKLQRILTEHNAVIIQKSHIANQRRKDEFKETSSDRIISWNDCSTQELMAASDVLITDYSSCFFDFLILDRPIIHYIYDYDYYSGSDRGLYYKKEEVVCGDAITDEDSLIESILHNLNNPNKDRELRKLRRKQYLTYENSDSCKTLSEYIMKQIKVKKGQ